MEIDFSKLKLTSKQMEAVREVEKAMNKANKLGVSFWEDYGRIAAYNNKAIEQPSPDKDYVYRLDEHEDLIYWLDTSPTFAVADDTLYFNIR